MTNLVKIDAQRRITLPKNATTHDLYMIDTSSDGTITLTPAIVRSALEDALRTKPGYMEALEHDAADPSRDVTLDWRNL
ncbi:hypothetical protein A5742_17700 [Mycolicibacterium fortuitum]|uniref:AbrB family transcriptional regulator n=1 Tax=Mycolicibacterium fortuitum TaxID=1766 RepID=A0ABD6QTU3_MYCFO|nr:hypothetical protein [Mycolicibacterium fortuitum]OMC51966.1 hypothetical protein A5742_17700 [Mycolicibacterium fortuitum]